MEIKQLNLLAYGPFTGKVLDFSASAGGLQIVYGPNEAGKSSALRALKALLFGIPARTSDNFLHDNKALRVGGQLALNSGEELALLRRKGNKNTLLSMDGSSLPDTALEAFLQGVNGELFELLFGIDHLTLERGGQEILEQKGEVGQALFAASLGSSTLHEVLQQLEQAAEALFKPQGSKPLINAAIRQHAQLKKDTREKSLQSRDWTVLYRELETTEQALVDVQKRLSQSLSEQRRLQRVQRAIPKFTARRERQVQLDALGQVVLLPEDFTERRHAAVLELENSRARAASARSNLHTLGQQLAAIQVNKELLAAGEVVEALRQQLGEFLRDNRERPGLLAEREALQKDARDLLDSVRPELELSDADLLQPVARKHARITELGNQRQSLMERGVYAKKQVKAIEAQLRKSREFRAAMDQTKLPDSLVTAVISARKQGDLDAQVVSEQAELQALERSCDEQLSRLRAIWQGELQDAAGLPLPTHASIDRLEKAFQALDPRIQMNNAAQLDNDNKLKDARQQLDAIHRAGKLPSEQDLADARRDRDRAWHLLRRQWLDGEDVLRQARELDAGHALPAAFEFRLNKADEVADRLRHEADDVQKQAVLRAAIDAAEQRSRLLEQQQRDIQQAQRELDTEWQALWSPSGFPALPPREMRVWLSQVEKLQAGIELLHAKRRQLEAMVGRRDTHLAALQRELQAPGEDVQTPTSLADRLDRGESRLNYLLELQRQRETLDREIRERQQDLDVACFAQQEADRALDTWKELWRDAVRDLGLGPEALPAEATELLRNIQNLFGKRNQAETVRIRLGGMESGRLAFRKEVHEVCSRLAPELVEFPPEEAVNRLVSLLSEAGKADSQRQQLLQQIQGAEQQQAEAEASYGEVTARLDGLRREAQCQDVSELAEAEQRSSRFRELQQELTGLEDELREIGAGIALEILETESDAADPDALPGEIDRLGGIVEELEQRKTDLAEQKGRQRTRLDLMDGSDAAVVLAEEAQSVLVEVHANAERYIRLKLASRILRDEIERYRLEHQGPLLERASEHFSALTQGSFGGLRTDFGEQDEPLLVGVRPTDERVHVQGMSAGTRDQLYLALRLASLEKYMQGAEPMPFIVDDILVHFDDDRSMATLQVLAELATKTQVILFTHHKRLLEQAQGLDVSVPVTAHTL